MTERKVIVLTHGGAGSSEEFKDGTEHAAGQCAQALESGESVLASVARAVVALENDSRFNAGVGSHPRSDGRVEMDAAVMDSTGNFGAVAAIEGYRNPVLAAEALTRTPYKVVAGAGAARFAEENGFQTLSAGEIKARGVDFSTGDSPLDTVGCVAFDGETFAAALSTGGIKNAIPGRVGDVPLIGCGLFAGPLGAVAATGNGESITMNLTAIRAYQLIEKGNSPGRILAEVLKWFDPENDPFGLILVTREGFAGGANRSMAWSALETRLD